MKNAFKKVLVTVMFAVMCFTFSACTSKDKIVDNLINKGYSVSVSDDEALAKWNQVLDWEIKNFIDADKDDEEIMIYEYKNNSDAKDAEKKSKEMVKSDDEYAGMKVARKGKFVALGTEQALKDAGLN